MKLSDRGLIYYTTQECAGTNNKTLKKKLYHIHWCPERNSKMVAPESKLETLEIEAYC